jgi:hypothetical protein
MYIYIYIYTNIAYYTKVLSGKTKNRIDVRRPERCIIGPRNTRMEERSRRHLRMEGVF